jgi:hypothetical protein
MPLGGAARSDEVLNLGRALAPVVFHSNLLPRPMPYNLRRHSHVEERRFSAALCAQEDGL